MNKIASRTFAALRTERPWGISQIILLSLALFLLPGCNNEGRSATTTGADIAGVYTLTRVDGMSVPCSLSHGGAAMTIKSGSFTINADGTCSSLTSFSVSGRGDVNREARATYTREGNKLAMKWERAGKTVGRFDGGIFTMTNEGIAFEYRR